MIPPNQFYNNRNSKFNAEGAGGYGSSSNTEGAGGYGSSSNTAVVNKQPKFKKLKDTFKSPYAEGFKKYVVTEDFVGTRGQQIKQFKRGMNLYAKYTVIGSGEGIGANLGLVSYAGYSVNKTKVAEKKPNVYEKIQNFFTIKKGFA